MNERPALSDRLVRHFDEVAGSIRLPYGSEADVVRTARRRTVRRRQLTVAASIAAVGGTTVLGLQQLTRTGDGSAGLRSGNSLAPSAADPPMDVRTPTGSASVVQTATIGDSTMTWRTVDPDSAAAVAMGVGGRGGTTFPGVIVSTAPGRSDTLNLQLWHSDDGVSFTPIDGRPPNRSLVTAGAVGEQIYTFGTAPGVAATDPNPLLASFSNDGGGTWQDATLPIDTNALRSLPGVVDTNVYVDGVAIEGDAVLVVARTTVQLDPAAFGVSAPDNQAWEMLDDGVLLYDETQCPPTEVPTTVEYASRAAAEAAEAGATSTVVRDEASVGDCGGTLRTWGELGIAPEVADAAVHGTPTLLYAPDGRTFSDITDTLGPGASPTLPSTSMAVVAMDGWADGDQETRLLRMRDGTWQELPTLPGPVEHLAELNGTLVAVHSFVRVADGAMQGPRTYVSTLGASGWSTVEVTGLGTFGTEIGLVGSGPGGLTMAVLARDEMATAETVPTTISAEPVGTAVGGEATTPRWYLVHTDDGSTFSAQPLDTLVGTDGGTASVSRISSAGNQVVVALTLPGTGNQTEPAHSLVLIGTPNG
jgi:hypothetical protein